MAGGNQGLVAWTRVRSLTAAIRRAARPSRTPRGCWLLLVVPGLHCGRRRRRSHRALVPEVALVPEIPLIPQVARIPKVAGVPQITLIPEVTLVPEIAKVLSVRLVPQIAVATHRVASGVDDVEVVGRGVLARRATVVCGTGDVVRDAQTQIGAVGSLTVDRIIGVHHPHALLEDSVGGGTLGIEEPGCGCHHPALDLIGSERGIRLQHECRDAAHY